MPKSKELTIRIEDKPGTLGMCCRSLADSDVNILAFQAYEREGQSLIRMVLAIRGPPRNCWPTMVFTSPKQRSRRSRFHIVRVSYPVLPQYLDEVAHQYQLRLLWNRPRIEHAASDFRGH